MVAFDDTGTGDNLLTSFGESETYYINNYHEHYYDDYVKDWKKESNELSKEGWYVPIKTSLPTFIHINKIRVQTRNKLPYK